MFREMKRNKFSEKKKIIIIGRLTGRSRRFESEAERYGNCFRPFYTNRKSRLCFENRN